MSFYCCIARVAQEKMISINQWLQILVTKLKRNTQECEFVDKNIIFSIQLWQWRTGNKIYFNYWNIFKCCGDVLKVFEWKPPPSDSWTSIGDSWESISCPYN